MNHLSQKQLPLFVFRPLSLRITRYFFVVTGLVILSILQSCQDNTIDGIKPNVTQYFDMDKFEENIKITYNDSTVGFSYAIGNGQEVVRSGANGLARRPIDIEKKYTPETRQDWASCSKFVTAVAVCHELEVQGKTLDELIYPYLPSNWTVDPSLKDLTFRQVLAHKSGLTKWKTENSLYLDLKKTMNTPQVETAYNYDNVNYALFRVVLPYLWADKDKFKKTETNAGANEDATAQVFRTYLRINVFEPAGLQYYNLVDFQDWSHLSNFTIDDHTLYYYFDDDPSTPGKTHTGTYLNAGSGNLILSAYEFAQILAAFDEGKLVSPAMRDAIENTDNPHNELGFDGWSNEKTHGYYFWKNGADSKGNESLIMLFPPVTSGKPIEVAICTNSKIHGEDLVAAPSKMRDAFDNAWVSIE